MRLLEPVAGIKTAQGHALFHLVFFIMMLNINTDICDVNQPAGNAPAANTHSAATPTAHTEPAYYFTFLEDHPTTTHDYVGTECACFSLIKWSHFATFLL